ncbi:MAG TPA: hypothetical protein VHG51_01480 [Longimicrobiaceae bacterium]|nr:hypothetical protein [Longimicrobiaceae bacterium]
MQRAGRSLLAVACAVLALAGCEGPAVTAPEDARLGLCSTSGECGPTDTRDPPVADWTGPDYAYSSRVFYEGYYKWDGGVQILPWTRFRGSSRSVAYTSKIASATVDAVALSWLGCDPNYESEYGRASKTVYGPGTAEVHFKMETRARLRMVVRGTHTFTAAPGFTGGGTFPSEHSDCN